ncbi:MAG: hypothetical protein ACW992_05735, partial [Candidatus Thorarchaeota archaeon]
MEGSGLQRGRKSRDRLGDVVAPSDLFDRELGAQMASWELRYQQQFMERVGGQSYRLRGFVHHTRNSSIALLTPSPWLHGGVF